MKKISKVLFSLVLATSLFSCGGSETSSDVVSSTSEQVSIEPGGYFNEDNFISSDKSVTKTKLVTYEGPKYLTSSSKVDVNVEGQDLFVYETRVNHDTQFSWSLPTQTVPVSIFDFEGRVHVEINVKEGSVTSAKVLPQVYGIVPTVSGNKISFDLEYSANYVVEYNDDPNTSIHLFANPLETNPITEEQARNDDSIVYIGPGVYKADAIPVDSNTTVYLAGGAYVYGQIRTEGLENVTIRGRGIISGSIYNRTRESEYTLPIEIRTSTNVLIEGITILDPAGWTITLYKSSDITIDNVKIITARQNGDGISVQACRNVSVKGGFVRTWDDSLVVKNVDGGSTKTVKFDGVTVWTDLAQSMEVGYEANGETMDDITFQNIIVLHNFHKAVISMHNADDAKITNVTYKDIIVEDAQTLGDNRNDGENDFLIDLCVLYNIDWSKSTNIKGTVENVKVENVKVYEVADTVVSRINGYSATADIKNVTIKNVEVEGKMMKSASDLGLLANDFTSGITVSSDVDAATGAKITLPYTLNLSSNDVEKVSISNIEQSGMLVPDFARSKGGLPYIGVASSLNTTANATHSAGSTTTTPSDDGSGDFSKQGYPASNAIDNNESTYWTHKDWQEEFPLYSHWSYDRIYRNDMIKQPDVLMFMFLYNQDFTFEQKLKNYEYYEPRCIHESSLSPSIHSIFACELGKKKEALKFFDFATRLDLDDYNNNTCEGIHTTSIAAAWMNIVYGFGGLRSDREKLLLNPTKVDSWTYYTFAITYKGSKIHVRVEDNKVIVNVSAPVDVVIKNKEYHIEKELILED